MPTDIKANELRINNYYKINKSVSIDENVFKLDLTDIRANKNICDLINPIPLTEEWLFKLGFEVEEMRNGYQYTLNGFCIWNSFDSECYSFMIGNDRNDINIFDIELKYLHKLQNLYFALTNIELVCQ